MVQALVTEKEQSRLAVGNEGWFYPDDLSRPARHGRLRDVRQDGRGKMIPEQSVYRVDLDLSDAEPPWNQVVRGVVHVKGNGQSLMGHLWARAASIFIRESGV